MCLILILNYFDVVICQGVLHHIPNYHKALEILVNFVKPGGTLILGLYHPAGKIIKKIFQVDYGNDVLFQDQELNPFEISLTLDQIKESLEEFTLCQAYPRYLNNYWIPSFLNYKNGGLVTYVLQKSG
jgi:ubiquinone/menaquinone biosynthesis C-methylase UbiE